MREFDIDDHVGRNRRQQHESDDAQAHPVHAYVISGLGRDRRMAMLLARRQHTKKKRRYDRGNVGVQHGRRTHAANPHHRRRGIADYAARPTGIGRRDDCNQITQINFAAENR